jgi:hypothetical protein
LMNYLDRYPLFSSKYLDYKNWKEIVLLMKRPSGDENKHRVLSDDDLGYAASKKDNMNSRRTYFNWDHLNKLLA